MSANERQIAGTHYAAKGIQHWDLVTDYNIPYLQGNASKYLTRWRKKNGLQDLEKSLHYIDKIIEKCLEGRLSPLFNSPDSLWGAPAEVITQFCRDNGLQETESTLMHLLCGAWTLDNLQQARGLVQALIAGVKSGSATLKR